MTEAWRQLRPGQRVTVVGRPDHAFAGRTGTFVEYTKPHGFARLHLDGEHRLQRVLVHPESLELVGRRCQDCGWQLPRFGCPHEGCNGVGRGGER
jgi:hypothetical protein